MHIYSLDHVHCSLYEYIIHQLQQGKLGTGYRYVHKLSAANTRR
jgi:hypothetical protein